MRYATILFAAVLAGCGQAKTSSKSMTPEAASMSASLPADPSVVGDTVQEHIDKGDGLIVDVLQAGNVLEEDIVWLPSSDETTELQQQRTSGISVAPGLALLREWLALSTATEEDSSITALHKRRKDIRPHLPDVLLDKSRSRYVAAKSCRSVRVVVKTKHDVHTGFRESETGAR